MKNALCRNKFIILFTILIIAAAAGISIYKSQSTALLDKKAYSEFRTAIEDVGESEAGGFADQQELAGLIRQWADGHSLEYKEDKYGNIIFDKPASGRKKNFSPTLIAVSMNYETAVDNARVLAAAAAVAVSDVEAGRRTVVFFNDEQGLAKGYKGISKKLISSKTKVIYLDKGASNYISTGSFQQRCSEITIPAEREENPCDTAVRISITGITSGVIGPGINKRPDPMSALSSLLSRLKSRSVDCRVAEVSVGNNGNMYPVSLDVTIVLNSYNLNSFTGYIDKRIKAWDKAYGDNYEDLKYEYEVIEDEEALPDTVYTAETTDKLTGILYTISSGSYKYSENDSIPEGKEPGYVYGINCLTDLYTTDDNIKIVVITQGADDSFTDRIANDNKAAAELYECSYDQTDYIDAFINDKDSLARTFRCTYEKVTKNAASDVSLGSETDNFFTPCSYLAKRNTKADIIHIRTKNSNAARIANTILCYIKGKGNTSIFK
ncbi:MAG: hypothetical protein MJ128_00210 [Mogibacterium sp.]|nr:hypothetical protein [Mogibacterium sp.]